ncbi:DotU family type IV/VI secretion system protein [Lysobacter sp. GX 14042]|uniref:DotU family type IV/VI secretion system protein n=1 Tax=Lysobacter sp. GX 14042 TaxID=2907155 RepID=UPI001F3C83B1|nr:DotU family type IV/VI secretion system protein [Lysobacter sp. GX 14042]MCE7032266.1 DotU family type IV/VI secretion system protein [Lysobacter sp. GX 14042]
MNYPNPPIPSRAIPSLDPSLATPAPARGGSARSLLDLMADGFHLLMLLRRGRLPGDAESFVASIRRFLDEVERGAHRLGIAAEDVYAARYAFCAAVDEAMLGQPSALREEWERNPLQLRLFGEHLAGEHFFDRLEELRAQGAPRLPSLEVCHYVLLLGFEGKYRIEGPEKLGYLVARLGDEITYLKGRRAAFAPHWLPPDRVAHALRRVMPLWAPAAVLALVGLVGWFGLDRVLAGESEETLAAYQDVVHMPGRTANLTITLP